jgi:hypothetical protein
MSPFPTKVAEFIFPHPDVSSKVVHAANLLSTENLLPYYLESASNSITYHFILR